MRISPAITPIFEHVISKPRLDSYKGYFKTKSTDEAIGLYIWNNELSACFGVLLSFFEIALRNNTHRAMSQFYTRGTSSSDHWYDKIQGSLKQSTINKIDEVRYEGPRTARKLRNPAPNPDEIVSRVSFGFWPVVLSTINPRYADQIFPKIFPHHPLNATPLDWKVKGVRQNALAFIYELNEFRNRIAHHEPIWKFAAIKNTSIMPHITVMPASRTLADSMVRFQRLLDHLDGAMEAINHGFHAELLQSNWRIKINYLLSGRGVARYRACKHTPAKDSLTPTKFRRDFSSIVKRNQSVRVKRSYTNWLFTPE